MTVEFEGFLVMRCSVELQKNLNNQQHEFSHFCVELQLNFKGKKSRRGWFQLDGKIGFRRVTSFTSEK